MQMRAARMHGYNQPLQIDDVRVPELGPTQVLIKVAATGMCRSDFQLVDGTFARDCPWTCPSHRDTRSPAPLPLWARRCPRHLGCPRAISSWSTPTG